MITIKFALILLFQYFVPLLCSYVNYIYSAMRTNDTVYTVLCGKISHYKRSGAMYSSKQTLLTIWTICQARFLRKLAPSYKQLRLLWPSGAWNSQGNALINGFQQNSTAQTELHRLSTFVSHVVSLCHQWHINSLWACDAIWQNRSGSTFAQVMAGRLTAPNYYQWMPKQLFCAMREKIILLELLPYIPGTSELRIVNSIDNIES